LQQDIIAFHILREAHRHSEQKQNWTSQKR
jgi:hypothetical protein